MSHLHEALPEDVRRLSNRQAVERYAAGAGVPAAAIAGLSPDHLRALPVPGTWSIQQIAIHLMDSDLVASYRMKRTIAEKEPHLDAFDETAFARRLHYHELDAALACETFRCNRLLTASILERLGESDFEREARHPEIGRISLGMFVRRYVHHLDHHLSFIRQKRALVGAGTLAPAR